VKKKDLPHYGCFFFKRTPLVTNWGKYWQFVSSLLVGNYSPVKSYYQFDFGLFWGWAGALGVIWTICTPGLIQIGWVQPWTFLGFFL
jgi:hypothetical protein